MIEIERSCVPSLFIKLWRGFLHTTYEPRFFIWPAATSFTCLFTSVRTFGGIVSLASQTFARKTFYVLRAKVWLARLGNRTGERSFGVEDAISCSTVAIKRHLSHSRLLVVSTIHAAVLDRSWSCGRTRPPPPPPPPMALCASPYT